MDNSTQPVSISAKGRLTSIDALRGFDMFWIIGGGEVVAALARRQEQGQSLGMRYLHCLKRSLFLIYQAGGLEQFLRHVCRRLEPAGISLVLLDNRCQGISTMVVFLCGNRYERDYHLFPANHCEF